MFEELIIYIFGDSLYQILLADYPYLVAIFAYLCFVTIILMFSYFVKQCYSIWR